MSETMKNSGIIETLDSIFVVNGEMIPDNGEDSYAFSVSGNYGMVSVFDGCGGIGSRKYDIYNNKTGAYISSHIAAKAFYEWFKEFSSKNQMISGNIMGSICRDIQKRFTAELKAVDEKTPKSLIKGSLTRDFPTTASAVMLIKQDEKLYSSFIWAGDSRGFILTPSGLSQMTRDDIEGEEDALSNLSNDGRLSNVISSDGNYHINCIMGGLPREGMLITATDGCFGYFLTPMEFEYMLVETLCLANSIEEWKTELDKYIRRVTGDDYTMGVIVYGYSSFKTLKKSYAERKKYLYRNYISKLKGITEEEKNYLWNEYKKDYYRGFN